jgi:hypothetical protein
VQILLFFAFQKDSHFYFAKNVIIVVGSKKSWLLQVTKDSHLVYKSKQYLQASKVDALPPFNVQWKSLNMITVIVISHLK